MASAVILAGGQGERFWPMTHPDFPKYCIRLDGKTSLLRQTYNRLLRLYSRDRVYLVTTAPHARIIRRELPEFPLSRILIEPSRHNTAAAMYLSCAELGRRHGRAEVVTFFPVDHLIRNEREFRLSVETVKRHASRSRDLVALGVRPTFPATGYGYIERGQAIAGKMAGKKERLFRVRRFVEKPDRRRAARYLRRGTFLWNGGIFTWRVDTFLEAMRRHAPEFEKNFNPRNIRGAYRKWPNISIDYALLEKADRIAVHETRMDWCDVGSWDMFFEKTGVLKRGVVESAECRNVCVWNGRREPLVVLGLSDLLVVTTPEGTLISRRGRSEEAALLYRRLGKKKG